MTSRHVTCLCQYFCCLISKTQFTILADKIVEQPELASDPRFSTNSARVAHRADIVGIITEKLLQNSRDHWLAKFKGLGYMWHCSCTRTLCTHFMCSIPFGPINNIKQSFGHPQALAREMVININVCNIPFQGYNCVDSLHCLASQSWSNQDGCTCCDI